MRTELYWVIAAGIPLVLACGSSSGPSKVPRPPAETSCGNAAVEEGEVCDLANLDGNDCTTVPGWFVGGTLRCNGTCDGWITSGCLTQICNNNSIEGTELCDGSDLDLNDCTTVPGGFAGGTLACNATCDGWNTSGCVTQTCNNNSVEGTELCDGTDLDFNDCTTVPGGFVDGTLACNATCDGWNTSGCRAPVCNDNVAEGGELCDGTDVGTNDCTTIGGSFVDGTLACNTTCNGWNTSGCRAPICNDNVAEGGEFCDGTDVGTNDCTTIGGSFVGGTLVCNTTCNGWNTSGCLTQICSNNSAEGTELCDGIDLRDNNCTTIGGGFLEGNLACNATCNGWNTSGCRAPVCNDNVAEGGEFCDGTDVGTNDCTTIGGNFIDGTLLCNTTCNGWDTSGCRAPVCNDNVAEGDEMCDGTDLNLNDCTTIGGGFTGGTLQCDSGCMSWDTTNCIGPEPVESSLGECAWVQDKYASEAAAGDAIRIEVDTINAAYASDLAFSLYAPSGGLSIAAGDDEMTCTYPPPEWDCPRDGVDPAPETGTYSVNVFVSDVGWDPCTNYDRSDYVISVWVNNVIVLLTLTADDVSI